MRFFAIFLSLNHKFSLKMGTMIACDNVYQLVEVKSSEKNFGGPNGPKKVWFIFFFFKFHRIIACNNF